MILGFIDEDGTGQYPKTINEAIKSRNIMDIIEEGKFEKVPVEWGDVYMYSKGDKLANRHQGLYNPYLIYQKMLSVTKDCLQNYAPEKCDITVDTELTRKDIVDLDCEYIVFEDGKRLASKQMEKFKQRNIPNYLYDCPNTIHFKKDGSRYKVNTSNNTITYTVKADDINSYATNFRGTTVRSWCKKWNVYNFANVIGSNDILDLCCINERKKTVSGSSITVMITSMFSSVDPSIFFRGLSGIISIKVVGCNCIKEYDLVAKFANLLLDAYENLEEPVLDLSENTLSLLRSYDPELFVKNYSRESCILPIPVTDDTEYENALEYPIGSGKYYTAPYGYYPGLKKNRLSNKDKFGYIVTCYKSDHTKDSNKKTYQYYQNIKTKDKKYVSLEECIDNMFAKPKDDPNVFITSHTKPDISVSLQELYNIDVTKDIESVKQKCKMEDHKLFRYFEEIYDVNIIVVVDKQIYLPNCPEPYFWDYDEDRETVIVSKQRDYKVFDTDPQKYIEKKLLLTARSIDKANEHYKCQYVDFYGKRRMVCSLDGVWKESVGAPLDLPNVHYKNSFIAKSEKITYDCYESLQIPFQENIGSQRHYTYL